jgi:peptidoglycan/LPS O-acetylase OafA/YrhL
VIAQLAYTAYLVNPIVAMTLHPRLAPYATDAPMAAFLPADFLGTFAAALVLHLLVERPLMQLRPR